MICAIGRAAKVLDFQSGQVGSTPTWHSVSSSNLQVWANGKPAAFEAVHWRFESFRLCCVNKSLFRSSNCWSLRLALNQKLAGSIPASGAEVSYGGRPVLVQELGCEPSLYRFNSVRSPFIIEALESIWWWSLTVDQVVASSILVKGAYSYGRHPAGLGRCLENSWR